MARKEASGKGAKKPSRPRKAKARAEKQAVPAEPSAQTEAEKAVESHVRGLLIRGEAAEAIDGKLPPGATHEIVEKDEEGRPTKIVRRRFSIY